MKQWFPFVIVFLLLLLTAPASWAQNSYNRWSADPPDAITPLRKRARSKPKPAKDTVMVVAAEVPKVKQSKLIKRGLTKRMREHRPLEEDSISVVFFARNSQYPDVAARAGAQGNVIIRLEIAPSGTVSRTSVIGVEPRPMPGWNHEVPPAAMQALANEAERVFRMLRFEPAARATQEELSASFSLQ